MRFTGYGSVALAEQGAIANDRGRLSQETAESGIARKPLQVLIFIIRVTRVAGHHTTFGQSAVAKTYPAEDQVNVSCAVPIASQTCVSWNLAAAASPGRHPPRIGKIGGPDETAPIHDTHD